MSTDRADGGSLLADADMTAVAAFPDGIAVAGEDDAFFDVLQELQLALLMLFLNSADGIKQSGDVVPAGAGIGNLPYIVGDFMASGGLDFTIEPHLSVFSGLQGLEREGEQSQVGNFVYPDNATAFAAAVSAFKEIVKEVG